MPCMICKSSTHYYFSKSYTDGPYSHFMKDFGPIDYYQCDNCGFVYSKTHQELSEPVWAELNVNFHTTTESMRFDKKPTNSPPYAEQALMLAIAGKYQLINIDDMLDYAGGGGD
jgi:hypothetical protein